MILIYKPVRVKNCSYIKDCGKVALLLDYDGTLAPIALHSDETRMDPYSVKFLNKLSLNSNIFIAFISGIIYYLNNVINRTFPKVWSEGRGVIDVKTTIGIRNCTYAGNHGMEIIFRNRERWDYELTDYMKEQFLGMVQAMKDAKVSKNIPKHLFIFRSPFH